MPKASVRVGRELADGYGAEAQVRGQVRRPLGSRIIASVAVGIDAPPEKQKVLEALLNLPAPPPPNPLETIRQRDDAFYDDKNPPPDNAPI